ncbi:TRAP transporter substrate-binding protein DctP [Synergistes jonesii]|uniref:TRAP transporter substrate-binding protein DctP n=1 Tax=Synergistes jonesii TaxID=2754 RepID=UPI00243083C0|nr:TRAP transporter substrate-binding protein DctP [Synergistes jonesii]
MLKKCSQVCMAAVCISFLICSASIAEAKPLLIRIGGQVPVDQMGSIAINEIAKEIEAKTNGAIKTRTYPASQLGDYVLMYEELMRGDLDMAMITAPTHVDTRFVLPWMPYPAKGWNDAKRVFDNRGWLVKTMTAAHKEKGVRFMGFFMNGFGGVGTTKPVKNILDFTTPKNIVLRCSPIAHSRYLVESLNFRSVTIPYAELYVSLQTGVADGWVGGNPAYNYTGFRDVIKYYYQINNEVNADQVLISEATWKKFTLEQQKIVTEAIERQNKRSFESAEAEDQKYIDLMKKSGIKVYTYTEEELAKTAEHVRSVVWEQMKADLGENLYKELVKEFNVR